MAGRGAGCRTVLVAPRALAAHELVEWGSPDLVVASLRELLPLFGRDATPQLEFARSSFGSAFANWPLAMTSVQPLARAASMTSVSSWSTKPTVRTRRRAAGGQRVQRRQRDRQPQIDDRQLGVARRGRARPPGRAPPERSRRWLLRRLAHLRREQHVPDQVDDVSHGEREKK